ncbi:diguanylate cyclase [Thiohalobacter sp. IOR34]|uniref:GGDEF domain-containing response regulator n=1 Tax=Thiohalobacter sp. IOR34 TaxID=3057176 RepID=UPI0025AFDFE8|nr:diguanylate cyclase [Thiohalobacter sp. IOR34]WJW75742.1 diguanylate cyclase [Thiohalobacter sp. IOR34]
MLKPPDQILVVDGSEVARTIIRRILDEELPEARISLCGSGREAIERLEQERFELITTALMLPDMDGLDLGRWIRRSRQHRHTPVVVVSGDADQRLLREGFEAGITDYFDKSLGHQAFVEFIKAFNQRHAGLAGRVLYVENDAWNARRVCALIENHGIAVSHTPSAEQAIEWLQQEAAGRCSCNSGFDIVITDFNLQGTMTGGDLLCAIRVRLRYSQQEMPVLMLTTDTSSDHQARVFHAGANDFVHKPIVDEILMARLRALLLIKQQFCALQRKTEEMHQLSITDSLTGVRNKRFLLDRGEQFVADRRHQPVAALLLDIDHFKQLNDRHGHITGDRVLETIGRLLGGLLRDDTLVIRFGGEEFAILLPRCGLDEAQRRAEDLRHQIEALNPAGHRVTVSIGVATTEQGPDLDLTRLLSRADHALYAAKNGGRNRISC